MRRENNLALLIPTHKLNTQTLHASSRSLVFASVLLDQSYSIDSFPSVKFHTDLKDLDFPSLASIISWH